MVEFVGAEMDNGLVVTAGIEHEDMTTTDMDKGLRDTGPNTWIGLEMSFDRKDRALDAVLEDRDRVRDRRLNQLLG